MFKPSYIKDELYEIAERYCCGSNVFRYEIVEAIVRYFNKHTNIQSDWYEYAFDDIGVFYVAWIENGALQTEAFAWRL